MSEQQAVLTEEINHAGDAMANPVLAAQEQASEIDNLLPHDERPGEQRVEPMNAQVKSEREQHKKAHKAEHKKDQKTRPAR